MAYGDQADPILFKQNDTRPVIRATIRQANGNPVNLTGATVVFNARLSTNPNTVVANRVATSISSAAGGVVDFTPTTSQTSTIGLYQAEFEVTQTDGGVFTVPAGDNYIWYRVGDDLA